ncbi:hypothetical protein ANCDUO_22714 [Ancylostoma duodenale]|uniref:Uncharacterized protein n=1 Tax=Ancylostoma duodenale TaxID=51022 RepID=A0A0C2FKE1_9BILA|nr:hypothetical protein ANCDUO_22714 [Ancylostoma duodenale]
MRFICYLLPVVFLTQRSSASYPTADIEEGSIAIAAEPVHHAPLPVVPAVAPAPYVEPEPLMEAAPVVAPAPVVAAAPVVAPATYAAPTIVAAPPPPVVVAQPQRIVAPAPVPVPVPYPVHIHHHNPRTEVHNVATHYSKETGHTSATAMVSGDHHAFSDMDFHPLGHLAEHGYEVAPLRARLHRKKVAAKKVAAEKVARKHASKKVARKHKSSKKN